MSLSLDVVADMVDLLADNLAPSLPQDTQVIYVLRALQLAIYGGSTASLASVVQPWIATEIRLQEASMGDTDD